MAEQGVTFPIVRDQGSQVYNDYFLSGSISPFPRDFIIDQNGIIRYTNVEYDISSMVLVIESLLEDPTFVAPSGENSKQPEEFRLFQNYPNPFNPGTTIEYQISRAGPVHLAIFDINGRKIKTLVDEAQAPGFYRVSWDGTDELDIAAASGIYVYRIDVNGRYRARKLTLIH